MRYEGSSIDTRQMSAGYNSVDLAEAVSSDLSSGECDGADG